MSVEVKSTQVTPVLARSHLPPLIPAPATAPAASLGAGASAP